MTKILQKCYKNKKTEANERKQKKYRENERKKHKIGKYKN